MNHKIARELVVLRAKNDWTQQQLAEELGTTQRTVAAWEAGSSIPRKAMQVRIARSFGLPDQYFLEESEEEGTGTQVKSMMEQIDSVLTDSELFSSVEAKNHVLKRVEDALAELSAD